MKAKKITSRAAKGKSVMAAKSPADSHRHSGVQSDNNTKKPVLVLDFDGVLHSYTSRWIGPDIIPDPPVRGAREFCRKALKHFDVIIVSTRCSQAGGPRAIIKWLNKNKFSAEIRVSISGVKPRSHLTIDDRAICFNGSWPQIRKLIEFQPWYKNRRQTSNRL